MPSEAYFTKGCHTTSPDHFVRLREWRVKAADRETTIYTDYCGYGDFYQFNKQNILQRKFLSPRYLVAVFYQMTKACEAMQRANLSGNPLDQVVQ